MNLKGLNNNESLAIASNPFIADGHDHGRCQRKALAAAKSLCQQRGTRLTALRQRVFELVWNSHSPVKAYDLLEQLKPDHPSAAPTSVYRALEFLLDHALIHRLQSLNAYIGCGTPGRLHHGQFLICQRCGTVAELPDGDLRKQIGHRAGEIGFRIEIETVEISGICANCQG